MRVDTTGVGTSWSEWRDEQEGAARDAATMRRHRLDVRARLREAMARGDRLWVAVGDWRVTGVVIEVDDDLLSLRTAAGRTDVRLERAPHMRFGVLERAAVHGAHASLGSGGFRGRLLAAEAGGGSWVVVVRDAEVLEGRVLVGLDHIDVVGLVGTTVTVTVAAIVALSPSAV